MAREQKVVWVLLAVTLIAIVWVCYARTRHSGIQIKEAPNVNGDQILEWHEGPKPTLTFTGESNNGLLRDAAGVWLVCEGRIVRKWTEPVPANSEALRRLNPCGAKP